MVNFFVDNFGNSIVLAVLIMAMIPTLESKVAIPFALSVAIWGENVLSPVSAFFVALCGSLIPAFFVILLARFVKSKTSGFVHEKFWSKIEKRYASKIEKANSKSSTFKKCAWVALFVAVPLPLTGTYSGGFIAGLLDLKIWQAFLSVAVGAAISCSIVLVLCLFFTNSTYYVFLVALGMIALWLFVSLCMSVFKRFGAKSKNDKLKNGEVKDEKTQNAKFEDEKLQNDTLQIEKCENEKLEKEKLEKEKLKNEKSQKFVEVAEEK